MICAIVLAAGRSQRMGAQKLLLPLRGKTVIACVVDAVLAAAVDKTFVVVGADRGPIADALAGRRVEYILNPTPKSEMIESLRCGLRALPCDCSGFLVVLGDQPSVSSETIGRLISRWRQSRRGMLVPVWEGRRGHPVLISASYREEILTRFDAEGLRGLLHAYPHDIEEVAGTDLSVLHDLDTPADYEREREMNCAGRPRAEN